MSVSPLKDNAGTIIGASAIARDVSGRKRAEEALKAASLYTRSLLEASLDPLVTISREGKITDVNQATEKVTGVTRDRLIGSDFCDYFTQPKQARRGYEEVFEQGLVRDYPLAIRHTSGQVTDVLYNASVFRNEQGEIEGVFAAARDVTERKRAERELRKASLYTRSLLEASLDPLVTISREGKITDVNEAAEKVTGVARERLIGSDFCSYFTRPAEARKSYERVFAEGSVCGYPLAVRHASGALTHVLYNATVFKNDRGEIEGVFAAARDITDRMLAEQEVRQLNQELEARVAARTAELLALNKELESFTYAVAHDLRAPLRHIHGFSDLLLHDAASTLSPDAQHWLDCVLSGTGRMGKLLEDLLNLSRLGKQTLNRRPVPLKTLVQEVIDDLAPETANRQIDWQLGDLPMADCDAALARVVFANLLSNAVKFTRPRTTATIEIAPADAEWRAGAVCARQRSGLRYEVRGQTLRRVPALAPGKGLRGDRHRSGDRAADSAEAWRKNLGRGRGGQGSDLLFHVRGRRGDQPTACRSGGGSMKKAIIEILLVEDNEYDIELTLRALHEDHLANTVHVARDGEEALAFLADCETAINGGGGVMPKLILLDLKLPKVDGHEVLRQVKGNPATKMIPVVVLTSSKQDEDMLKSYLTGVNSYIQKPVNFEQFRKIVKDLGLYWLVVNQLPAPVAAVHG